GLTGFGARWGSNGFALRPGESGSFAPSALRMTGCVGVMARGVIKGGRSCEQDRPHFITPPLPRSRTPCHPERARERARSEGPACVRLLLFPHFGLADCRRCRVTVSEWYRSPSVCPRPLVCVTHTTLTWSRAHPCVAPPVILVMVPLVSPGNTSPRSWIGPRLAPTMWGATVVVLRT